MPPPAICPPFLPTEPSLRTEWKLAKPRRRITAWAGRERFVRIDWRHGRTKDLTDESFIGFDDFLAETGHPRAVVRHVFGDKVLTEVLATVQAASAPGMCPCDGRFRTLSEHGQLTKSSVYHPAEDGSVATIPRCTVCGRRWLFRSVGRRFLERREYGGGTMDCRCWRWVERSGGTVNDCVESRTLTVDARSLTYEELNEGRDRPDVTTCGLAEFLSPESPVRRRLGHILAGIEEEVRRRLAFAAGEPFPPAGDDASAAGIDPALPARETGGLEPRLSRKKRP